MGMHGEIFILCHVNRKKVIINCASGRGKLIGHTCWSQSNINYAAIFDEVKEK